MADDVVTGDAVHSRADEARRALHAARRRGPAPEPRPHRVAAVADDAPPDVDPRIRALTEENQALRSRVADLEAALAHIHQRSAPTPDR